MNRSKMMIMLAKDSKIEHIKERNETYYNYTTSHNRKKYDNNQEKKDVYNFEEESEDLNTSSVSVISGTVPDNDSTIPLNGFSSSESEYLPSDNDDNKSEDTCSSTSEINKLTDLGEESPISKVNHFLDALPSDNQETTPIQRNLPLAIVHGQNYVKKQCARERPTICPFCFADVVTHFPRHLLRHHGDKREVKLIRSLKPRTKKRTVLINALRKQGNFHLKVEKNILHPVRNSKNPNTEYFVCTYCLGYYSKKLLYKHVKVCNQRPIEELNAGKKCLIRSQSFMATVTSKNHEFLKNSRIKEEVFGIMRADQVSAIAKSDPLICLYGETLLNKHKRKQIGTVISNKIREIARLLIVLKKIDNEINGLFDCLKPQMFQDIVSATRIISGYDAHNKMFRAPSLALHMGTNLKLICDIALKLVIQKTQLPGIKWNNVNETKVELKELKKLIEAHWCNELSSLALKTLTERKWLKPIELPLASDIQQFSTYLNDCAKNAYNKLNNNIDVIRNYKILTECVLSQTIIFNRKRVGDVQYLKIDTYNTNFGVTNQEAFMESLTPVEKLLSKKFKRVVEGGKGSKPVPILFSQQSQKYINCLLKARNDFSIVPASNPYLFANPESKDRWMAGGNVLRKLAKNCGLKNPTLLTSTKFRKHIATTLQLLNMDDNEMEQVATFLGHTKKTHAEFYRIPQDIYQTAKVAKLLLLLEKGKGKQLSGKNLNDIEVEESSESDKGEESDDEPLAERVLNRIASNSRPIINTGLENVAVETEGVEYTKRKESSKTNREDRVSGRIRWSEAEKTLVKNYFKEHIQKKIPPKKYECENLISCNGNILVNKDWVRVKTFVYNTFRKK